MDRERVARASSAVQSMFGGGLAQSRANTDLLKLLPLLVAAARGRPGGDARAVKTACLTEGGGSSASIAAASAGKGKRA